MFTALRLLILGWTQDTLAWGRGAGLPIAEHRHPMSPIYSPSPPISYILDSPIGTYPFRLESFAVEDREEVASDTVDHLRDLLGSGVHETDACDVLLGSVHSRYDLATARFHNAVQRGWVIEHRNHVQRAAASLFAGNPTLRRVAWHTTEHSSSYMWDAEIRGRENTAEVAVTCCCPVTRRTGDFREGEGRTTPPVAVGFWLEKYHEDVVTGQRQPEVRI